MDVTHILIDHHSGEAALHCQDGAGRHWIGTIALKELRLRIGEPLLPGEVVEEEQS